MQYKKQMYTIRRGSNPANLDAFLSDKLGKTAVFCEMKFLEWLGSPGALKDAYLGESYFFKPDNSAVGFPIDAYSAFRDVIMALTDRVVPDKKTGHNLHHSIFAHYDAWQMLKAPARYLQLHFLCYIYSIDSFGEYPSMAGLYDRILLLNVVKRISRGVHRGF